MLSSRIYYDSHMHTPLCKHAVGEPENYAEVGHRRGLKGIIVTCHNPAPDNFAPEVRMNMNQFDDYVALVARATAEWAGKMDVRLGLESDYFPGMESYLEKLHASAPLNYVLGSVHPQLYQYRTDFYRGDPVEFMKTYFTHLAWAAETGLFDSLAHPDLVKNIFPTRWNLSEVLDHVRAMLDRVAKTGIAMELNTSGLNKAVQEMNPGPQILREMCARNIPVVVGSDAHNPGRVSASFEMALGQLIEVGYTKVSFFLDRKRQDVEIAEARASLVA